jgi:hypothetical protein
MKTILKKTQKVIPLLVAGLWLVSCGSGVPAGGNTGVNYTQIERLARPAVNEGLVISNTNLNLWNSIPPSADLSTTSSGALNAVATEAIGTLTVVANIGINVYKYLSAGGNLLSDANFAQGATTAAGVATIHALQFVPDVMRIDVSGNTGTHSTAGNPDTGTTTLSNSVYTNSGDAFVAYSSCVNGTTGLGSSPTGPLLCGGRKIRDNSAAITLSYLVFGAEFIVQTYAGASNSFGDGAGTGSWNPHTYNTGANLGSQYVVNDGYTYANTHTGAQSWYAANADGPSFPYLPAPYTSK